MTPDTSPLSQFAQDSPPQHAGFAFRLDTLPTVEPAIAAGSDCRRDAAVADDGLIEMRYREAMARLELADLFSVGDGPRSSS